MATAMKPVDGARNETRSRQASQDEGSRLLDGPDDDGVGGGSGGGGGSSCGGGCGGFCERLKPKVSLCLGTTAALSFVAFLFLVPFVVDPAVSRLIARYSPEPGTCALHEHVFAAGLKQCTWSSCREGCTSAITRCHQLTVDYSLTPYQRYVQARRQYCAHYPGLCAGGPITFPPTHPRFPAGPSILGSPFLHYLHPRPS